MIRNWATAILLGLGAIGSAAEVEVPLRNIAAGTFYVEGTVSGIGAVDFLVDTGSGYTSITPGMLRDLQAAGAATYLRDLIGIMADGSRLVVPVYHLPELHLGGCVIYDIEAAVFASSSRPILGMRSLSKISPFTLSTDPPALSFSQCQLSPPPVDVAEQLSMR
ncbi:MAG: clan AA aspartic protease [Halioglobus sp.]|nr:clan AA aspartic protease [Halioglobus sp.]